MKDNKLIAEFIGRKGYNKNELYTFRGSTECNNGDPWYSIQNSKFHSSWDWLMLVVSKIVSDYEFNERYELVGNRFRENIMDIVPFCNIEDTYEAVVEFIKWYNVK